MTNYVSIYKAVSLLLILSLSIFLVAGCSGSNETESTELTFVGSSSLAPIIASVADEMTETFHTWNSINTNLPNAPISIFVTEGGSGQGIRTTIDGTSDFGMSTRWLNDSEKEEMPDYQEFLVGIDALTIAVNPQNPLFGLIDDLTQEQIVRIFSGEYITWQDVDPSLPNNEIIVVVRDAGGSAVEVFQDNIMGDAAVRIDAIQAPSMGALTERIMENPNAIGYPPVGMVANNVGSIVTFKINGIEPSVANIIDGSYFLSRPMLLVTSNAPNAIQQAFLDVMLGELGQERMHEMGYVRAN